MHVIKEGGAFTNHPGYIEFKGKSYLFYHNGAVPGGGGFKRSVCIEPFQFNADGSISLIAPTNEGVKESASNVNPFRKVEAETIGWEQGIETAKNEKTGVYVTDISNGDYIKVRSVDFAKGAKKFEASTAAIANGGSIEIHLDNITGTLIGTCKVKKSGDLQNWTVQSCKTQKVGGVHDVYFVFKGGEGNLFNFDWWKFTKKE
jgi:hypothetical protein